VRAFQEDLATPHERIALRDREGAIRIHPVAQYLDEDKAKLKLPVTLRPIREAEPGIRLEEGDRSRLLTWESYERTVLTQVEAFLRKTETQIPPLDRFRACEEVLVSALQFHVSEQQKGARADPAWEPVRKQIVAKLHQVRRSLLDMYLKKNDLHGAAHVAGHLVKEAPGAMLANEINDQLGELFRLAWESKEETTRLQVFAEMRRWVDAAPEDPQLQKASTLLDEKAREVHEEAKKAQRRPDAEKLKMLANVLAPGLIDEGKTQLTTRPPSKGILRVGVRELPGHFSPLQVNSDEDRYAVELLFESLMEWSNVGSTTGRYRPDLAEAMPQVTRTGPRGEPSRDITLPSECYWSDGRRLGPGDVRTTIKLLRDRSAGPRSGPWGAYLDEVFVAGGTRQVTIPLARGCLDPLSLLSFKVLPQHLDPASGDFDKKPVGSGPYLLDHSNREPNTLVFKANPFYGERLRNQNLPGIQEIHFLKIEDADRAKKEAKEGSPLVRALKQGEVQMALNLTAEEVGQLQGQFQVGPPHATNPRVWFLAVNHREAPLNDPGFRQALAAAVDRNALLDEHFRKGLKLHRPLASIFPTGSWASTAAGAGSNGSSRDALHDPDLARGRLLELARKGNLKPRNLTLKYLNRPDVHDAMTALKGQLERALRVKDEANRVDVQFTIELQPRSAGELYKEVEVDRKYDLAYYSYDFFNRTFWPGQLLGPSGSDGQNYLGYLDNKVANTLVQLRDRREYSSMQELMHSLGLQLALDMPVVPLWQLDPLHAYHKGLQVADWDPHRVFNRIELWGLE
jgi:ABC-type oligopeptide transport system substrate-binding subunit